MHFDNGSFRANLNGASIERIERQGYRCESVTYSRSNPVRLNRSNKKYCSMKTALLLASLVTSIAAASAASPLVVKTVPAETLVRTNSAHVAPSGTFSRPQTTFQTPVAPSIPVTGTFSRPQTTFSSQTGTFSRPEGGTFDRPETTFDRPQTTFSRPQGTFSPLDTTFSRPQSTFQQPLVATAPGAATQIMIPPVLTLPQLSGEPKVVVLELPPGAVIRKPILAQ